MVAIVEFLSLVAGILEIVDGGGAAPFGGKVGEQSGTEFFSGPVLILAVPVGERRGVFPVLGKSAGAAVEERYSRPELLGSGLRGRPGIGGVLVLTRHRDIPHRQDIAG
jgi:hypothetical protein